MNLNRTVTKALPLLLGVGLVLSACAAASGYGAAPYAYNGYTGYYDDPGYDSLDFGFGDFDHFRHDRDFDHGHEGLHFAHHVGGGFAHVGGHGFAGHGGFGGHGGGGHR